MFPQFYLSKSQPSMVTEVKLEVQSGEGSRVLITSYFLIWVVAIWVCAMYKNLCIKLQMLDGAAALEDSSAVPQRFNGVTIMTQQFHS